MDSTFFILLESCVENTEGGESCGEEKEKAEGRRKQVLKNNTQQKPTAHSPLDTLLHILTNAHLFTNVCMFTYVRLHFSKKPMVLLHNLLFVLPFFLFLAFGAVSKWWPFTEVTENQKAYEGGKKKTNILLEPLSPHMQPDWSGLLIHRKINPPSHHDIMTPGNQPPAVRMLYPPEATPGNLGPDDSWRAVPFLQAAPDAECGGARWHPPTNSHGSDGKRWRGWWEAGPSGRRAEGIRKNGNKDQYVYVFMKCENKDW